MTEWSELTLARRKRAQRVLEAEINKLQKDARHYLHLYEEAKALGVGPGQTHWAGRVAEYERECSQKAQIAEDLQALLRLAKAVGVSR